MHPYPGLCGLLLVCAGKLHDQQDIAMASGGNGPTDYKGSAQGQNPEIPLLCRIRGFGRTRDRGRDLIAIDYSDFERFIAARLDLPYRDCDEQTLLRFDDERLDIPEKQAIIEFGRKEFGLEDDWCRQLVDDCVLNQPIALYEGKSWIMSVLHGESYGKIHFRTIAQVKRFRELGNRFYAAMPNPVLRGWKPSEIENPPVLPDDIPEKDEDIPDSRKTLEEMLAQYGGRERVSQQLMQSLSKDIPKKKVGPNDPCPCGSGKKYKKCCGR